MICENLVFVKSRVTEKVVNSLQLKKKSDLSAANLNGKASGFQVKCYDRSTTLAPSPVIVERQRVTRKCVCGHL